MPAELANVVIIGAGQAGLAVSYYLSQYDVDHVIIERESECIKSWKQTWDSFQTITCSFQTDLPGQGTPLENEYSVVDRDILVQHFRQWTELFEPNIQYNEQIVALEIQEDKFKLSCESGIEILCTHVVIASGYESDPYFPSWISKIDTESLNTDILHSMEYKNPAQIAKLERDIIVVGSGLSGTKIAYELADSPSIKSLGKKVFLSVGRTTGAVMRSYRGHDVMYYGRLFPLTLVEEAVQRDGYDANEDNKNRKAVSNISSVGPTISQMAKSLASSLVLMPKIRDIDEKNHCLLLEPLDNVKETLRGQTESHKKIKQTYDSLIEKSEGEFFALDDSADTVDEKELNNLLEDVQLSFEDKVIIFATGFKPSFRKFLPDTLLDYSLLGEITNKHGRVIYNKNPINMYVIGLPMMRTRQSGLLQGMMEDAKFIADTLHKNLQTKNEFK